LTPNKLQALNARGAGAAFEDCTLPPTEDKAAAESNSNTVTGSGGTNVDATVMPPDMIAAPLYEYDGSVWKEAWGHGDAEHAP
jgi:hypothetical protein